MPFSPAQILLGFIAPAVCLALIAALAWRFANNARWIFPPLIAIAFSIAYKIIEPKIAWPPTANVLYLLFYLPLAAAIFALVDSLTHPPLWLRALILAVLWYFAARLILIRLIPHSLSATNAQLWMVLSTFITLAWWLTFETLANRAPGITTPLLLAGMSGAAAIFLATGWHIQNSAALAGIVAIICFAALAACVITPKISFSRGFAEMIVIILQLLLLHGYFFTDDDLTPKQQTLAALLMIAPLLALLGNIPKLHSPRPLARLAIRLLPVVIVVTTICAITINDYLQAEKTRATMQDE